MFLDLLARGALFCALVDGPIRDTHRREQNKLGYYSVYFDTGKVAMTGSRCTDCRGMQPTWLARQGIGDTAQ